VGNQPKERRADAADEVLNPDLPSPRLAAPSAEPAPAPAPAPRKEEDRVPLIWRLSFGGLLSLVALVSITLYHQLNNGIVTLRADLNSLNVKAGNMVNKDEFNSRVLEMNTRNATLQGSLKELQQANAAILALRERSALLEQQVKSVDADRRDLARDVQRLREQLAVLEARPVRDPGAEKKTRP
jgi:hypothetical protein